MSVEIEMSGKVEGETGVDDDEAEMENEDEREDELDQLWANQMTGTDLPSEYLQIQKLIKYITNGNPTATLLALCSLSHYDYSVDLYQKAIFDGNGMELFLNILETNELFCQVASLKLISILSKYIKFRRHILSLNGTETLIQILQNSFSQIQSLSAEILSDLIASRRAAHVLIENGGIQALMAIMGHNKLMENQSAISRRISGVQIVHQTTKWAAIALSSIAQIKASRKILYDNNVIQLVVNLLETPLDSNIRTPAVKIIQNCVTEPYFHQAILENGVIELLINILNKENCLALLTNSINTLTKCASSAEIRRLIRELDGLKYLVNILLQVQFAQSTEEKQLLSAVTGAVWKCSTDDANNVAILLNHKIVEHLAKVLLSNSEVEICRNVLGALSECVNNASQMKILNKKKAIANLIGLLCSTDEQLLINICKLLTKCCVNDKIMKTIEEEDGIRHLWSLLKSSNPEVQCCAGQTIYGCISKSPHITELVRNFVGGLELLVDLLNSPHVDVLTSACGVMSAVAKSTDNLAIIIDNDAVVRLSNLTTNEILTRNAKLQHYLADAIANCCSIGGKVNVRSFGDNRAVFPLVDWMQSEDGQVRHTAVKALAVLSTDKDNCLEMHQHGAVKLLLNLMNCEIESVQEDAATTLANIRKVVSLKKNFH